MKVRTIVSVVVVVAAIAPLPALAVDWVDGSLWNTTFAVTKGQTPPPPDSGFSASTTPTDGFLSVSMGSNTNSANGNVFTATSTRMLHTTDVGGRPAKDLRVGLQYFVQKDDVTATIAVTLDPVGGGSSITKDFTPLTGGAKESDELFFFTNQLLGNTTYTMTITITYETTAGNASWNNATPGGTPQVSRTNFTFSGG